MSTPTDRNGEDSIDKIVRRLDLFPELVQALRDGDLLTGRLFCAQLFDFDGRQNHPVEVTPTLQAAMKALLRLPENLCRKAVLSHNPKLKNKPLV